MKEKLYIAYGSNLDQRQMARRCPTAEVVCSGMLYGHELLFRGSQFGAVATVVPKPGACVPVLVWKIKPSDGSTASPRVPIMRRSPEDTRTPGSISVCSMRRCRKVCAGCWTKWPPKKN